MDAYGLEDEEELEPLEMEGGVPNVPRNPDADPRRQRMKSYLQGQGMGREPTMTPEMRAMDRAPGEALRSNDRDLALANLFMQSANQVGTIGGKTASSAPFSEYTKQLQASNQGAMGDIQRQRAEQTAEEARQQKIRQYMADKMMTQEERDLRRQELAEEKKYRRGLDERRFEQRERQIAATAGKQKEPTEGERKFGAFADRAQSANDAYEAYIKENPKAASMGAKDMLIGKYAGDFAGGLMSDEAKMSQQLEKEFIGSVLRPETGAAASDDEWAMYGKKYFPRAGDTPEIIARKNAVRKQDIGTMRTIAGKGASNQPTTIVSQPTTTSGTQGAGATPSSARVPGAVTGGLSPEEQAELDELEAQFGGQ